MAHTYHLPGDPVADPAAVVERATSRVTVVTPALLRIEHAGDGVFEDRPSTFAVNRRLPVPSFEAIERDGRLLLTTDALRLSYDGEEFSAQGLTIGVRTEVGSVSATPWRFGDPTGNLGGTARTVDDVDGAVPLGPGVAARRGIAVIDDSTSFVLDDGTPVPRDGTKGDLYVFVHGTDYPAAVRDLFALSGPVPVLPRWVFGNWWSRYHPYSAREYAALLDRFDDEGVPLSVAVIDTDWHITDVDPRLGSGWTGYTWNRDLFPEPEDFLASLHARGLHVALNVHPADGIRAHEERYAEVADAVGIDPDTEEPVEFDATDPTFMSAYFDLVHHPLEEAGVDLWWLDWQQGSSSRLPGVDPLWLLNMAHFADSGRGGRRPLTFSRYAGPGSHRYPIGFSGDAVISWDSLDFQPYFTATASNIGYGWWSHDIGGHIHGYRDDELTTRWVQLGTFSPVNRLHSTRHPFIHKEPWSYPQPYREAIDEALRFRHRLVPYLHTMNARAAFDGVPLVVPMSWYAPRTEPAYECAGQAWFGTEMVLAPITAPDDPVLRLGATHAWLPPGRWTDLFTGLAYAGDREVLLHRDLTSIPVLVKAGGIVPLAGGPQDPPVDAEVNPAHLEFVVSPGADGSFVLREEDGDGDGTDASRWVTTTITWDDTARRVSVAAAEGPLAAVPTHRHWWLTLLGAGRGTERGATVDLGVHPVDQGFAFVLETFDDDGADDARPAWTDVVSRVAERLDATQLPYDLKLRVFEALSSAPDARTAAARLQGLRLTQPLHDALAELVLAG